MKINDELNGKKKKMRNKLITLRTSLASSAQRSALSTLRPLIPLDWRETLLAFVDAAAAAAAAAVWYCFKKERKLVHWLIKIIKWFVIYLLFSSSKSQTDVPSELINRQFTSNRYLKIVNLL